MVGLVDALGIPIDGKCALGVTDGRRVKVKAPGMPLVLGNKQDTAISVELHGFRGLCVL